MNKIILTVQGYLLYPENYSKEQLDQNYRDACFCVGDYDTWTTTYGAASYASSALATYIAAEADAEYIAEYAKYVKAVEYWVNRYFELTGENKQDYIDAINKDTK